MYFCGKLQSKLNFTMNALKNKYLLSFAILIFSSIFSIHGYAQTIIATDSTQISILTCSPGPISYEKFGHTALRIRDDSLRIDVAANWGIFDFNQPGFYLKFVKGETIYMLGIYDTNVFLDEYKERNSSVMEQVLNLTKDEKQKLIDAVLNNYLPENRNYLYNFVFDNCSTRPRDLIESLFRNEVTIEYTRPVEQKTFREWVEMYADKKSWLSFGINLTFGKDADRLASRSESMFLPEIMSKELSGAKIVNNINHTTKPLVSKTDMLVEKRSETYKNNLFLQPLFIVFLIFVAGIAITVVELKKKKYFRQIDGLLLFISGLAGIIIFYLMFFSIHPLVKNNYNILWCNPLNILTGIFIWTKKLKKPVKIQQMINIVCFLSVLIIAAFSFQSIEFAFIPLIALLLIRSIRWLQANKQ